MFSDILFATYFKKKKKHKKINQTFDGFKIAKKKERPGTTVFRGKIKIIIRFICSFNEIEKIYLVSLNINFWSSFQKKPKFAKNSQKKF